MFGQSSMILCTYAVQPLEADDRPKILCEFVTQVHSINMPYECHTCINTYIHACVHFAAALGSNAASLVAIAYIIEAVLLIVTSASTQNCSLDKQQHGRAQCSELLSMLIHAT